MKKIYIRNLKKTDWSVTSSAMHLFTNSRSQKTLDELWFTEHNSIFTTGILEKNKNIIKRINNIPVIQCNRGGKITYHGPGQQLVYMLINLKLKKINIKKFLFLIEKVVIHTLKKFQITAYTIKDSPGVYINKKKFCFIGLRIKNHCSLYGISYNINVDLNLYKHINPCGNKFIKVLNLIDIIPTITMNIFRKQFIQTFLNIFKYQEKYKSSYNIFNKIYIN
ncbi:Octanoyltransferase [Buchnera aphidicola (Chaitophorus sp. 3695)]|uniref:lipoyl(octanoyl) transferase LipB n=1 Tax=Buchnera aphidicola TaxID=9 RepID=UPI003464299B